MGEAGQGWFDRLSRRVERAVEAPQNALFGGRAVTESAREQLERDGVEARATVLSAPNSHGVTRIGWNTGRFGVRIEVPGQPAYETTIWMLHTYEEWERLPIGATVDCRVDPRRPDRAVLLAPGLAPRVRTVLAPVGGTPRVVDSSGLLATGHPADAVLLAITPTDRLAPGTNDHFCVLDLELTAPSEPRPWRVRIHQRVPAALRPTLAPGAVLRVAYRRARQDRDVAVNWPASTGGVHA